MDRNGPCKSKAGLDYFVDMEGGAIWWWRIRYSKVSYRNCYTELQIRDYYRYAVQYTVLCIGSQSHDSHRSGDCDEYSYSVRYEYVASLVACESS